MASQPIPPPFATEQQGQGQAGGLFGAGFAPAQPVPPVVSPEGDAEAQGQGQAPVTGLFGAGFAVQGGNAAPGAPLEGFRIQKRKAEDGNQGARTKQRKEDAKLQRALIEFKTFSTDATSKPQGKDFPRGSVMKTYNAHKVHPFVLAPLKGIPNETPSTLFMGWKTWFNFESQNPSLVLSNGHYQIHLRGSVNFKDQENQGDFVFLKDSLAQKDLSRKNIKAKVKGTSGRELADVDAQKLLDFAQPSTKGADKDEPKVETGGLHLLSFELRKNKKVQITYTGPRPQPALSMTPEVENLVKMLEKNSPVLTLLRQNRYILSDVDACWCSRIRCVVRKGLLPFYKDIVRQVIHYRFSDWIKNPEKELSHQPWMQLKKQDGTFLQYASHPGKSTFSDMKEWETILSVALIHEIEYENMCNQATFSHTNEHEAQVIHKSGKYIQLAVSVKRHEKVPTPKFPEGSRFTISKGTPWVQKPAEEDQEMGDTPPAPAETDASASNTEGMSNAESLGSRVVNKPETQRPIKNLRKGKPAPEEVPGTESKVRAPPPTVEDAEDESAKPNELAGELSAFQLAEKEKFAAPPPPKPKESAEPATGESAAPEVSMIDAPEEEVDDRRRWRAKALAKETNRSFVISFLVDNHEKDEFKNGQMYNVTLEMQRNLLPSRRQLNAIAVIAEGLKGGDKEYNDAYNNYLNCFILGKKLPQSPGKAPIADLKGKDRELFEKYVATLRFNKPQQDFFDSVIKSTDNANILQGPPGCGKTFEDATVATSLSIIGKRTGFFCPTNKACEATMDAVISEFEKVISLDLKKDTMKCIFFPTSQLFKEQLNQPDSDLEALVSDIVDDADTSGKKDYKPYMLWTHVINHQKIRAADSWQDEGECKDAKQWLVNLEKIRKGEEFEKKTHKKTLKQFLQTSWRTANAVICDQSVKVIVSTCSNAASLKEMGFLPNAVIIDESAFGTEADSLVPLSLFAEHIILSGDHKQLLPNVKCLHHAEYCNQQGIPIFERVLRNGNVPLFQLKINYRMHEEIALLPGALSYGFLGCSPSTAEEDDVFKFFKSFWYSADGAKWRNKRQKSPFRNDKETKGTTKKNIRRLFFNTKGSRSAHPDESTSYVNYGNAMAIVEYVCCLLGHYHNVDKSKIDFKQLRPSNITIVTGYTEQKEVIEKLLKMALTALGWKEFPTVVTIDSIQGGQNDIIILDITAANEHHASFIGFIGKWNRSNVALTRAKKVLSIFGNLECWRTELYHIAEVKGHKKFAYFCMDVLDGDVIDVTPWSVDRIPATIEEFMTMDPQKWSIEMPHMDPKECKLSSKFDKMTKTYKASPKQRVQYEKKLWDNLQLILKKRTELEEEFLKNNEVKTNLFDDLAGDKKDIVHEMVGGTDEDDVDPKLGLPSTRMNEIDGGQSLEDKDEDEDVDVAMIGDQQGSPIQETEEQFFDVEDPHSIQDQMEIESQIDLEKRQAEEAAAAAHDEFLRKQASRDADDMDEDEPETPKDSEKEALRKTDGPSRFVSKGPYRPPHRRGLPDRSLEQHDEASMMDAPQPPPAPSTEKTKKRGRDRGRGRGGGGIGR